MRKIRAACWCIWTRSAKDYENVRFSRNTENFASYCREQHPDAVVIELVERWKDGQEGWCKGLYDLLAGT